MSNYEVLVYALGQRGDLTLLEGLDVPEPLRQVAMIYLVLGYLQAKAPVRRGLTGLPSEISGLISEMITNDPLQQAVAVQLGLHFGLSPAEQEAWIDGLYENRRACYTYGCTYTDEDEANEEDESDESTEDDEEDEPEA